MRSVNRGWSRWAMAGAAAAVLVLTGCESKLTQENFAKVTKGQSLAQVQYILGSGDEDTSHGGTNISGGGIGSGSAPTQRVFVWKDGSKKIVVIFEKDKVVETRSEGL